MLKGMSYPKHYYVLTGMHPSQLSGYMYVEGYCKVQNFNAL